jgi:pimeloyl-ACP methyl ester carboxylesterase
MAQSSSGTTGYAEVDGGRLYYEAKGDGRPLVLLHGGLVNSGLWDRQFDVFARQYRVVRYDLRGFGKSSDTTESYSHVEDLHALLGILGIERAHVLGLSMSGTIALDFTLTYPEQVSALVHIAGGVSGYEPESVTEAEERLWAAEGAAFERGDITEAVESSLLLWTVGPDRRPDQVDREVLERVREMTTDLYGRGEGLPSRKLDPPAVSRLGEIRVPTLIVHGDQDVSHIAEVAEVIVGGIRGARKVIIPGTAHHPNMEKPDEFNRIVLDFLREVDASEHQGAARPDVPPSQG